MKTPWLRPRKYWFVLTPDSLDYYSSNERGAKRLGSLVLTSLCSVVWPDKQTYKETGREPLGWAVPSHPALSPRGAAGELCVPRRVLEHDSVWQEALLPPVHRALARGRALGVRCAEGDRQQSARADAHTAAHARCGGERRAAALHPAGSPGAAAAIASPLQEHCGSPEVLEQIYRCNPILRYTSSPLYAPLLPFPYGSLDQSGERCMRYCSSSTLLGWV